MTKTFAILVGGQYHCSFWTDKTDPEDVVEQWKERWVEANLRLPSGSLSAVEEPDSNSIDEPPSNA